MTVDFREIVSSLQLYNGPRSADLSPVRGYPCVRPRIFTNLIIIEVHLRRVAGCASYYAFCVLLEYYWNNIFFFFFKRVKESALFYGKLAKLADM